ncbi:MAG: type IV pilus modification protein PilV [Burkholderiaceae bacterium]|nr:type IV pilus modification protein PilV [Sulfuritalea sp.]MCF8174671.1 type IV pilus modification protein PilV [Burkholderiaceae bacterium]
MQLNAPHRQRGSFLIEALIAMVIFAIGVLGLVGLQGSGVAANTDIAYRIEAAQLTGRMMATIQAAVRRNSLANFTTDLASFDHNSTGDQCILSGTESVNPLVVAWVNEVRTAARTSLPEAFEQIRVTAATNQVRIVLCWQQPGIPVPRRYVLMGTIS